MKHEPNAEEAALFEQAKKGYEEIQRLYKLSSQIRNEAYKVEKLAMSKAKKRIRSELKKKIKTLPRKKKNGDKMSYSIQKKFGYIGSCSDYGVPFILTKFYKKVTKAENEDIVREIRRMADKIGYKVVEKC